MLGRLIAVLLLVAAPAAARELRVGLGESFARPSEAAAAARPGDTILVREGVYQDCAVWRAADLEIVGASDAVVITGPVCAGKALFVVAAPRITIRSITFQGAVAQAGNGAGIRAEGGDLRIQRSRFVGNQNGILTAASLPEATLLIEDSIFIGNGAHETQDCAHGLYAGVLRQVTIRRTRFEATRICHHVKSRAANTEITDSFILDGPTDRASYLVDVPNGGNVLLRGNDLRKGPNVGNPTAAVVIGAEGVRHPTADLRIENNRFVNLQQRGTIFVRNLTEAPAELAGNRLVGDVTALQGPGHVR